MTRDALLWVALVLVVLLEWMAQDQAGAVWWKVLVAVLVLAAAVAASRPRPLLALFVVGILNLLTALDLVVEPGPFPLAYIVALFVVSYLAGRRLADTRLALLSFTAVVLAGLALAVVLGGVTGGASGLVAALLTWFYLVMAVLLAGVIPWLAGRVRHQQAELSRAGWQRAEQLEREQRIVAEQERLRERTRIAQDMHDSLGHELSLVALRAGALELAPGLDEPSRQSAGQLRQATATAADRLHDIIGVLREGTGSAPTQPAGEDVADLVERARASGMAVELRRDGEPVVATPMVDRAAHRVVQEALTNAAKHAPGAAVAVRLIHRRDETVVTVVNEPPAAGAQPDRAGGQRGLIGLRERVRLVGGALQAGPNGSRPGEGFEEGFEVVARLPHGADAVRDVPAAPSESARHLEDARRLLRSRLVTAIAVPVGLGATLVAASLAYYAYTAQSSVLDPVTYAGLQLGADRVAVEPVLPPLEMIDPPDTTAGPPPPPGSSCLFYRSTADVFPARFDAYRLCFSGGQLTAKHVVPTRAGENVG